MQSKLFIAFLCSIFISYSAQALLISGGLGLGSTEMKNETTEVEGPLTQAFTVERLFHSRLSAGVEHLRSMTTGLVTSASFTGLLVRYYLNAAPVKLYAPEELSTNDTLTRDYSTFVGFGFGFAQSSRLPNNVGLSSNAAGFYVSPRGGIDIQLGQNLGVRGECIFATTLISRGSVTQFSLGSSLYWIF